MFSDAYQYESYGQAGAEAGYGTYGTYRATLERVVSAKRYFLCSAPMTN